jgi:hypothetical protein
VVSWDDTGRELVVTGVTGGPFTAGEDVDETGGGSGAQGTSATITSTWMYDSFTMNAVFATEDASDVQTIWIGLEYWGEPLEGYWKIVTDGTTGATRAFTWNPPTVAVQGLFDTDTADIVSWFFFDASVGVAGTTDGIYTTSNGGTTWTTETITTLEVGAFAYSSDTLAASAYLYTIDDSGNVPIRIAVTYTAGTPGTWAWETTTGWETHGDTANYVDMSGVDGAYSIFYWGQRIFVMDDSTSAGYWGWGDNVNAVTGATGFDMTPWQDTWETYLGGNSSLALNPAEDKDFFSGTGAPTGYILSMCRR